MSLGSSGLLCFQLIRCRADRNPKPASCAGSVFSAPVEFLCPYDVHLNTKEPAQSGLNVGFTSSPILEG